MSARDLTDKEAEALIQAALHLAKWINGGGLAALTSSVVRLDAKINEAVNGAGAIRVAS